MEVFEKINQIIISRKITKREFAKRLISLEPKLHSTGEIPTEKTIYKYLDGSIAIKIELIPYIAEALKITEQELFLTDKKKKIEFLNNVVKYASKEDLEILNHRIGSRNKIENIYSQTIEKENFTEKKRDSDLERLINLLSFAPKPLVLSLILKLEDLKKYIQNIDKI